MKKIFILYLITGGFISTMQSQKIYHDTKMFDIYTPMGNLVETGIDRWIGYDSGSDEDIYMTDGSYIEVYQETYSGKVSYTTSNHSAITTEDPVWFSKNRTDEEDEE